MKQLCAQCARCRCLRPWCLQCLSVHSAVHPYTVEGGRAHVVAESDMGGGESDRWSGDMLLVI